MNVVRKYPIPLILAALVLGVLIGRSDLFGYSSAEDCAIHAHTNVGASSCYYLYKRAADK
jgi:hypothetical protein